MNFSMYFNGCEFEAAFSDVATGTGETPNKAFLDLAKKLFAKGWFIDEKGNLKDETYPSKYQIVRRLCQLDTEITGYQVSQFSKDNCDTKKGASNYSLGLKRIIESKEQRIYAVTLDTFYDYFYK